MHFSSWQLHSIRTLHRLGLFLEDFGELRVDCKCLCLGLMTE